VQGDRNGRNHGKRWRTAREPLEIAVWATAAFLLLLPLIAMQFTSEVNWDETDFIVFGAMLAVACGTYELATRATSNGACRAAVGIAVAAAFILVWMNLAVGIIGTEDNPLNLMYGGVLAVAIVGSLVARFQPDGMATAMVVTALAQASVAAIAQVAGHFTWVLTAAFVALWLGSASLFRKAAREQPLTRGAP
jgi:hypothetical protein